MKNVVFGFLGSRLDAGASPRRWERWRPTVSLCASPEFRIDRLELLLHCEEDRKLARTVSADINEISPDTEIRLHVLPGVNPWDFPQMYGALHDIARAYRFREDERYHVHLTAGSHVAQICLFLLAEARYFPAILVETSKGQQEVEPWRGKLDLIDLDLSAYDQLASRFRKEQKEAQDALKDGIATRNAAFNELIRRIELVCLRSSAPVLLLGPTGAGKSQLARRIHALRASRHLVQNNLVEVNCATLRGDNAMSTLFGHRKGAFTGAVSDRPGLLKAADGGTLFLDEIGELGLDEQAMLLHALEEKRFRPMGSDNEISSSFQLIVGTNRDLTLAVRDGIFREDLLARINLWSFRLPGLAERTEDLEPNLDHELERAAGIVGHQVSMNAAARASFLDAARAHPWPGNFRDFGASVLRMATLAEGGRITEVQVRDETRLFTDKESIKTPGSYTGSLLERILPNAQIDPFDTAQLEEVLRTLCDSDSLADAGRRLFRYSRTTKSSSNDSDRLRKYLARFGLEYKSVRTQLLTLLAQG